MKIKITLLLTILITTINFAQTTEIEKPETYTEVKVSEPEPIPFQLVEIPPLAPDCKTKRKVEKQKKCFVDFIVKHFNRKFNTNLASDLGFTGRTRFEVDFIIDKEGKIKNITATGGPDIMNQHAVEVIKLLPQFTPALKEGKPIEVAYHLPVIFDNL